MSNLLLIRSAVKALQKLGEPFKLTADGACPAFKHCRGYFNVINRGIFFRIM